MPSQYIYKPNQTRAGFLLAEKIGLVWKYAGKAFNKIIFQAPLYCTIKVLYYCYLLQLPSSDKGLVLFKQMKIVFKAYNF
jgi:hypothetical protein